MAPSKASSSKSAGNGSKRSSDKLSQNEEPSEPTPKVSKPDDVSSPAAASKISPPAGGVTPVHVRHAIKSKNSPSPNKPSYSGRMKVTTTAVQSMDMLAIIHGADGKQGAFCFPLMQCCNSPANSEMIVDKAYIHGVCWMRHPDDPERFYEDSKKLRVTVAISLLPPGRGQKNTQANREAFARNICGINNHDLVQAKYMYRGARTEMEYVGDIASANSCDWKKLSAYLTIDDIWYNVIVPLSSDPETNMSPPNQELLEDKTFLLDFYEEDLLPQVRRKFSPKTNDSSAAATLEDFDVKIAPLDFGDP